MPNRSQAKSLDSNFHMWRTTLGFQILFRNLGGEKKPSLLRCSLRVCIQDSFLNLSWRRSPAPPRQHREEKRLSLEVPSRAPLASERVAVINYRCVRPASAGRLHKNLRLHAAPASQCEGLSIKLLKKKIQL